MPISLDLLRRVFHRWLSVARFSRHRRLLLREKEDQIRLQTLDAAWDKWREKLLRPQEDEILLQCQRNILCRVFSNWHGKTKVGSPASFPELDAKSTFQ
jgi:protein SFI1